MADHFGLARQLNNKIFGYAMNHDPRWEEFRQASDELDL
jgi:hypothetical protein